MHAPPTVWASFREFAEAERKSRIKAGGHGCRPAKSQLPAVRAVTGSFTVAIKSGVKNMHAGITVGGHFSGMLRGTGKK